MGHRFASIGFNVHGPEAIALVRLAERGQGELLPDGDRLVRCDDTGSGARIVAVVAPDGTVRAAKASYLARRPRRVRALVVGLHPVGGDPHADLVHLAPVGADLGLVVELEDGARGTARLPFGQVADFELVALADALEVFADERAYLASGMPVGIGAVISSGLFPVSDAGRPARPRATIICTGRVLDAAVERNEWGGGAFLHVGVRTYGMDLDVVVDPAAVDGPAPRPGLVVSGSFRLVARLPELRGQGG